MKNCDKWCPSKYAIGSHGVRGSRNKKELSPASLLITDLLARELTQEIPQSARGDLLDLGCGKAPLYGFYKRFVDSVTCADWDQSYHGNEFLDVACDLTKELPFASGSFDTVLMTDVLEHIPTPSHLIGEIYRILRPNGRLLMSTPFMYHLHEEPYDYYRYTEHSLRFLAEQAGYNVLKISSIGGSYSVIIDLISKSVGSTRFIGTYASAFLQEVAVRLPRKVHQVRRISPLEYFSVLEKK